MASGAHRSAWAGDEFFGSAAQVSAMRKACALWSLIGNDPRLGSYGRVVSIAGEQDDTVGLIASIASLTGASGAHFIPASRHDALSEAVRRTGLTPARWEQYWGQAGALAASRAFLAGFATPRGLGLSAVSSSTPRPTLAALAALALRCGVLPPPGFVLRSQGPRGICLYAQTASGDVIAAGASFLCYHPESRFATEAWWGMLAVDEAWRGRRLAPWIGAQLIVEMWERFGARGFSSGVKADNPASQAMCDRLGVGRSDCTYLGATDAAIMGGQPITR